jgi:hypothetical protein
MGRKYESLKIYRLLFENADTPIRYRVLREFLKDEEADKEIVERECEFSSNYYSPYKAKHFPLSIIIKARKL